MRGVKRIKRDGELSESERSPLRAIPSEDIVSKSASLMKRGERKWRGKRKVRNRERVNRDRVCIKRVSGDMRRKGDIVKRESCDVLRGDKE
tara:strand:- start:318 stop:590 length:273 start_codon:yes stop_codon:yes gene_type:complete